LGELRSLANTAGAHVVDHVLQKRSRIDSNHFVGKGKAEHIAQRARDADVDVIIFDNDLTPAQIRDLEEITGRKIIDRSELILDIFATHARTAQARLQVELAQLQYTAPRLRGMWRHLERIAGAGGASGAGIVGGIGTRGPGERQIEIDRRIVQRRVTQLRRELARIDERKLREVHSRRGTFTASLIGYTNAGKSTLMHALTGADVYIEDKLFATLDTKTVRWELNPGETVLLSDTVGFVRDLPHHLVASFRATLEEAIHADLLIHVVDASSHIVDSVLSQLDAADKPQLAVLNKIDVVEDASLPLIAERLLPGAVRVSAKLGAGLDELRARIREHVRGRRLRVALRVDAGNGRLLALLAERTDVISREYSDSEVRIEAFVTPPVLARIEELGGQCELLAPSRSGAGGEGAAGELSDPDAGL
jgi:GTP-binding protein HflX